MKRVTVHSIWLSLQKGSKSTDLWCLVFLSAIFIFFKLGSKSLTTFDEIFYAQFSKEMFANGNWLTPMSGGHPEFDKPPLYMCLTAMAYHLFGVNEWATRLFSALAGIGTLLVVYLFSRDL